MHKILPSKVYSKLGYLNFLSELSLEIKLFDTHFNNMSKINVFQTLKIIVCHLNTKIVTSCISFYFFSLKINPYKYKFSDQRIHLTSFKSGVDFYVLIPAIKFTNCANEFLIIV